MKESNFQSLFGKYLQENPPARPEAYELKICKGPSLPFDAVKDHQVQGLKNASLGLYHKISDSPIFYGNKTRFTKPKPFDCVFLKGMRGYVAILFYKPRKKKRVYLIDVQKWETIKEASARKSLTEMTASQEADRIIIL